MSSWIEQYGYLAVLGGTLFEGEASYLAGAVAARLTELNIIGVMIAGYVGGFIRDFTIYSLARHGGKQDRLIAKVGVNRISKVRAWIDRSPFILIIFHRFIYGFSTATLVVMGLTGISRRRFLMINTFACLVWVLGYGALGYFATEWVVGRTS